MEGIFLRQSVTIAFIALCIFFAGKAWPHPGAGIVVDRYGQVYFVLSGAPHDRIMKIDAQGKVAPFIIDKRLRAPHHLVIDADGNLYTVSDNDGIVWKITPAGKMKRFFSSVKGNGIGGIGTWGDPFTIDRAGNIYYIDYPGRNQILKITSEGEVTTLAGSKQGFADGKGNEAKFGDLHGASMTWSPDSMLYVTDGSRIRKVTRDGTVLTLAIHQGPRLGGGVGIAIDANRNVYVADYGFERLLKLTPEGEATTLAGSVERGTAKKAIINANLEWPTGVAIGPEGDIYVMDHPTGTTRVWKISPDGNFKILASVK